MITFIIIFVCGVGFLLFNELEDECQVGTWEKHQQFMNADLSWKNKWKLDALGNLIPNTEKHWYYFYFFNPKYKERFIYSSTLFVFLTDGEHLFQFIKLKFIWGGFLIISWQVCLAWVAGTVLMQAIKEAFLKNVS